MLPLVSGQCRNVLSKTFVKNGNMYDKCNQSPTYPQAVSQCAAQKICNRLEVCVICVVNQSPTYSQAVLQYSAQHVGDM